MANQPYAGRVLLVLYWWPAYLSIISKKEGKDQESIQSNTTPDPGGPMGK